MSSDEANAKAWRVGFDLLKKSINDDKDYTFETTLGGNSITRELHRAIDLSRRVGIFYIGLTSPELHIERVATRVAEGGHNMDNLAKDCRSKQQKYEHS